MLRLIQKWLKAGVLEDGVLTVSDRGTGQGSVISPLLANVYLHYVFDLWAERWRHREAVGNVIIVRYADDLIIGFELDKDARRFQEAMCDRLREFSLSLHPEKTRLIEFGRFAVERRARFRCPVNSAVGSVCMGNMLPIVRNYNRTSQFLFCVSHTSKAALQTRDNMSRLLNRS
jgi:hypothetical protein